MKLYNVAYSGNSYKVRLLLAQLGIPCEIVEVDILKGESRTPEFLKINPNGRTPVLDDGSSSPNPTPFSPTSRVGQDFYPMIEKRSV
jgi:glutathione S-transferase